MPSGPMGLHLRQVSARVPGMHDGIVVLSALRISVEERSTGQPKALQLRLANARAPLRPLMSPLGSGNAARLRPCERDLGVEGSMSWQDALVAQDIWAHRLNNCEVWTHPSLQDHHRNDIGSVSRQGLAKAGDRGCRWCPHDRIDPRDQTWMSHPRGRVFPLPTVHPKIGGAPSHRILVAARTVPAILLAMVVGSVMVSSGDDGIWARLKWAESTAR